MCDLLDNGCGFRDADNAPLVAGTFKQFHEDDAFGNFGSGFSPAEVELTLKSSNKAHQPVTQKCVFLQLMCEKVVYQPSIIPTMPIDAPLNTVTFLIASGESSARTLGSP